MKIRLLLALVRLAISFALPTFAQEKEAVDPQIRQQLDALAKKFDEASNKADAAALAALFTQDAVEVAPEGLVYGRQKSNFGPWIVRSSPPFLPSSVRLSAVYPLSQRRSSISGTLCAVTYWRRT